MAVSPIDGCDELRATPRLTRCGRRVTSFHHEVTVRSARGLGIGTSARPRPGEQFVEAALRMVLHSQDDVGEISEGVDPASHVETSVYRPAMLMPASTSPTKRSTRSVAGTPSTSWPGRASAENPRRACAYTRCRCRRCGEPETCVRTRDAPKTTRRTRDLRAYTRHAEDD